MKEIQLLMRVLTHLNAAGVLALCGWLAMTAASQANEAGTQEAAAYAASACDCRFTEVQPGDRGGLVALAPQLTSVNK